MANPNPEFIKDNTLQELLRDKDTGLPLSNGQIFFYEDKAPTVLKDIYKITGSAPNYSFIPQANPLTLNSIGAVEDTIYYKPFTDEGVVDPYFVEVFNSSAVSQFSRQNWPDVDESDTPNDSQGEVNYIPNGQFLLHTDIPAQEFPLREAGEITQATTEVAYGGFRFERAAATSKDFVLFSRVGGFVTSPEESPRYKINIVNTDPTGSGIVKDLRLRFEDVNKFASSTQQYTFKFDGQSASGDFPVDFEIIKNYGTGGSATDTDSITTFTIEAGEQSFQNAFVFGDNTSKTIGTQDDDYVEISLRFPVNAAFNGTFTNFVLVLGDVDSVLFPPTTDEEMSSESLTLPIPKPDSSNLFLPIRLGREGLIYDDSGLGVPYPSYTKTPPEGSLYLDGSQYETAKLSSDGIPYSRLQGKFFDTTLKVPFFGTGPGYFISYIETPPDVMRIVNNTEGQVTDIVDGSTATGFTFATIHKETENYFANAYMKAEDIFEVHNKDKGAMANQPNAQTSLFTITEIQRAEDNASFQSNFIEQQFAVKTVAATSHAGGEYFTFDTLDGVTNKRWYVWWTVNGVGVDPAPVDHTAIKVALLSSNTASEVAQKIQGAINGFQISTVKTLAASTLSGGEFFEVDSTANQFYVWYTKDGVGTDPAPGGGTKIGIKVELLAADTAILVADKTREAINKKFFAVDDMRGMIIKGVDDGSGIDDGANKRLSLVASIHGDLVGTFQASNPLVGSVLDVGGLDERTTLAGQKAQIPSRIRPYNRSYYWFIKY